MFRDEVEPFWFIRRLNLDPKRGQSRVFQSAPIVAQHRLEHVIVRRGNSIIRIGFVTAVWNPPWPARLARFDDECPLARGDARFGFGPTENATALLQSRPSLASLPTLSKLVKEILWGASELPREN